MQSSTMVVVRTLVMLAALVAVPVAALFGNSIWARLAKAIAALQEDPDTEGQAAHEPTAATPHSSSGPTQAAAGLATPPAPAFSSGANVSPISATPYVAPPADAFAARGPLSSRPSTASASQPMPTGAASFAPPAAGAPSAMPLAATSKTQLSAPAFWPAETDQPANPIAQVQAQSPPTPNGTPPVLAANQAAYITPAESTPMPPPPAFPDAPAEGSSGHLLSGTAAGAATMAQPTPNQTAIERRLQALGALHYRLETAGAQGELFRFQCKIGLEANPNYVGYFEATSSDSLTAMKQVLEQVESWRAGVVRR